MFDNWMKSVEDLFDYGKIKKQVEDNNKRVIKFWKDWYQDLISKFEK